MFDFSTPISRVRNLGRIEGVSFLLLVGVAMPMKHFADQPLAVTYFGWVHGILFMMLALVTLLALIEKQLSFKQCCIVALAAVLPFGPFFIDRYLPPCDADEA
jgi:integral membrane protein